MKKTLPALLIIVLFFICISINAQDTSPSKISHIKLYLNGSYHYEMSTYTDYHQLNEIETTHRNERYNMGNPSIAIEINKGKFFVQEVELMPVDFERIDEIYSSYHPSEDLSDLTKGGVSTSVMSALRYQAGHYFISDKFLLPYLAVSTQFFYEFSRYEPYVPMRFPMSEHNIGLLFSCIPGITIRLNKKLGIDINFPLAVYDFRLVKTKIENPLLPLANRKDVKFEGDMIPDFVHARFGICYRFKS